MVYECVYFGECLALVLYVPQGLDMKIVIRVEPSFCYPQRSAEVAPVRFLRFRDLVSPVVRREAVCICLDHPPLILGSDCFFI